MAAPQRYSTVHEAVHTITGAKKNRIGVTGDRGGPGREEGTLSFDLLRQAASGVSRSTGRQTLII